MNKAYLAVKFQLVLFWTFCSLTISLLPIPETFISYSGHLTTNGSFLSDERLSCSTAKCGILGAP